MGAIAFRDDPTRVMHVVVLSVFSFLALVAVVFRLWARKIQKMKWELSDYLIVMGLVWALGLSVFSVHSKVYWDAGADVTQFGSPDAIRHLVMLQGKALLVGETTWATAVFFIRASILALYIRIFRTKSFRTACYIIHGVNAAFLASIALAVCLICRPISLIWNRQAHEGSCGDQRSFDLYLGSFNLFMDVTVVVLPMPVLWGLQMAVNKKLVLSAMFGLGIIICIITLIRTKISAQNVGSNSQSIYSLVALFTSLETLLGVINACLPVMKPIFTKFRSSKVFSWLSSITSGSIMNFMRPSQMGSHERSDPSRKSAKRAPTSKYHLAKDVPLEPRWPSFSDDKYGVETSLRDIQYSSPSQYVDSKSANPRHSTPTNGSHESLPMELPSPPVPPKGAHYNHTKRRHLAEEEHQRSLKEIHVRKDWDIERGEFEETDRQGLVRGEARW